MIHWVTSLSLIDLASLDLITMLTSLQQYDKRNQFYKFSHLVEMVQVVIIYCVVLGSQIILQLFCHNSDIVDCEWLTITHIWTNHFFFTNHTLLRYSCKRFCDPQLFSFTCRAEGLGQMWVFSLIIEMGQVKCGH